MSKTLGQMTPEERRAVIADAKVRLQAHLTALAPHISEMWEADIEPERQRSRTVIHRGPIPGTDIGRHWFEAADGNRYGIQGWPHGINKGWSYEVVDREGRTVDDSMFRLAEIREWAQNQ